MAIAVNGGHVSRALDFYERENKYFIIGGSTPWDNEPTPDSPVVEDYKLRDVIGLKRVDNTFLVVPDDNGEIVYRSQKWRKVSKEVTTSVGVGGVVNGDTTVPVDSVAGFKVGDKVRINNSYEGLITSITGLNLILDTASPSTIPEGSPVLAGALIEGAKYVYVEGYLEYDRFPLVTYRQIGLCTEVTPANPSSANVLRSAAYNTVGGTDEYSSLGILEILDNRTPITRDISMRELISMVIEF